MKLGEILLRAGVIGEEQLRAALAEQKTWGHRLGVTLVKMGFVSEQDLVNGLANQLGLPIANVEHKRVLPEVLELVPREYANKHMCLPLFVKKSGSQETLFLGMDDPCNLEVLDDLSFRTGKEVRPVLVTSTQLCTAIDRLYKQLHETRAEEERAREGEERSILATGGREPDADPNAETLPDPARALRLHEAQARGVKPNENFPLIDLEDEHSPQGEVQSGAPPRESDPLEIRNREILQVLTRMLVEKGIIDGVELAHRLAEAFTKRDSE